MTEAKIRLSALYNKPLGANTLVPELLLLHDQLAAIVGRLEHLEAKSEAKVGKSLAAPLAATE